MKMDDYGYDIRDAAEEAIAEFVAKTVPQVATVSRSDTVITVEKDTGEVYEVIVKRLK